ncbi:MAG: TIGR02453 family protein [Bacteroidetes bacterium]|nr:MAG: TIGR02453 family protein [Bacteroidota bacterium]
MTGKINPNTFKFLQELNLNNNREWFQAHKERYLDAHSDVIEFAELLIDEMNHHDQLVPRTAKQSLFRIYRDIRFSKDKTPYKTGFMGSMKRDTKWLRGGYYFKIAPNNQTAIIGGFWGPNSSDITRIRQEIGSDPSPMRKIISARPFLNNFGQLDGDELKTAPKGFSKEHPDIDLLRKKQFLLVRNFNDEAVLKSDFLTHVVKTFRAMRPFLDYMSEVLTTDENGVPIE